jgi:hypothetical protein
MRMIEPPERNKCGASRRKRRKVVVRKPRALKEPRAFCGRTLPCWLYGRLYRARNAFLHGNPVSPKTLHSGDLEHSLFWLAPSLYRLALTGALNLRFKKKLPKGATAEQIGNHASARMDFNDYQMIAERALLRARK